MKTTFDLELEDPCPFCSGYVAFGSLPKPFAAHTFPHCKQFFDLGALKF